MFRKSLQPPRIVLHFYSNVCRVATSNAKYEPSDFLRMPYVLSSDDSQCTVPSKTNADITSHAAFQRALSRGRLHSVWENFLMLHVSPSHHSRAVLLVLIHHSTAHTQSFHRYKLWDGNVHNYLRYYALYILIDLVAVWYILRSCCVCDLMSECGLTSVFHFFLSFIIFITLLPFHYRLHCLSFESRVCGTQLVAVWK